MGIKVELTDGTVKVGGSFQSALRFVKGQKGRSYNPATKTWAVPQTIKQFCDFAGGFPIDILSGEKTNRYASGNHITRYGNAYTRNEWDATNEARQAESCIRKRSQSGLAEIEDEFRARMAEIGITGKAFAMIWNSRFDIEFAEECGKIGFSSPERKTEVLRVIEWYGDAISKHYANVDDAVAAEQEKIWNKYGVE